MCIEAELKGSRWRSSGRASEEGQVNAVTDDLRWNREGAEPSVSIHRVGSSILTNGWWVVRASIVDGRVASLDWQNSRQPDAVVLTWTRLE